MLEREAMAVLVSAMGVGYAHRQKALAAAGSALALLEDPYAYEKELTPEGASSVRAAIGKSERMLESIRRRGIHLIAQEDTRYPKFLRHIARPPHLLFCMGEADLQDTCPIAVVGTRGASEYGLRHTRAISRDLAKEGVCVVSGLALGIDAASHRGALDTHGRTVAVLGGALDRFYPMDNWQLLQQILEGGGSVISEYAPGVAPNRYSFLERNRIIAGMSLGTLVTEGPMRSGALHTARCALEEGREVFALPGDVDRAGSALPNRLIAEGALAITCAGDILDQVVMERNGEMNVRPAAHQRTKPAQTERVKREKEREMNAAALSEPEDGLEKAVVQILSGGEADFDFLSEKTGVSSEDLGAALMMLELDGRIDALPGCRYRLA